MCIRMRKLIIVFVIIVCFLLFFVFLLFGSMAAADIGLELAQICCVEVRSHDSFLHHHFMESDSFCPDGHVLLYFVFISLLIGYLGT